MNTDLLYEGRGGKGGEKKREREREVFYLFDSPQIHRVKYVLLIVSHDVRRNWLLKNLSLEATNTQHETIQTANIFQQ